MKPDFEQRGFDVARQLSDSRECDGLIEALGPIDQRAGRRGVLSVPAVTALARSPKLLKLIRPCLRGEPFAVRAIYFNKSPEANWGVGWHQDLAIAVKERFDVPEFEGWSVKHGVPHVLPPVEVLERMITVRLHLDDADASNGALRVIPGSQCAGRLSSSEIEQCVAQGDVICQVEAGDALLMRPLLLHASSRSISKRERRVLHIEYASAELPYGLCWHFATKL